MKSDKYKYQKAMKLNFLKPLLLTGLTTISLFISSIYLNEIAIADDIQVKPDPSNNYAYGLQGIWHAADIKKIIFIWWNGDRYTWCDVPKSPGGSFVKAIEGLGYQKKGITKVHGRMEQQYNVTYWSQPCTGSLFGF